jgi:hypothetical protein
MSIPQVPMMETNSETMNQSLDIRSSSMETISVHAELLFRVTTPRPEGMNLGTNSCTVEMIIGISSYVS